MQKNCELIRKERGWGYNVVILPKERGWGSFNISKTQGPLGNVCDTNRQVWHIFLLLLMQQLHLQAALGRDHLLRLLRVLRPLQLLRLLLLL